MSQPPGVRKYVEFHQFSPRKIGRFHSSFEIPREAKLAGPAVNVLYHSDKLNPTTLEDEGWIDYIHEHEAGVNLYRTDAGFDGPIRKVPRRIWNAPSLVRLGDSLGFAYEGEDGKLVEGKAKKPLPELYTTPDGKALIVVQSKRRVLALIWGGRLGVEARGIVN